MEEGLLWYALEHRLIIVSRERLRMYLDGILEEHGRHPVITIELV